MSHTIIYKESLEHGPYPKQERLIRNKAFLNGLPACFPKDLKTWMAKQYIDIEPCQIPIIFGKYITNRYGSIMIPIRSSNIYSNYRNDTSRLIIQTPKMITPFGLSTRSDSDGNISYTLAVNFDMNNQIHQKLYNNIRYLEEKVKKYNDEKLLLNYNLFCSRIQQKIDRITGEQTDKYPRLLNFTLKQSQKTQFFNEDKVLHTLDEIKIHSRDSVQLLFEIKNVWIIRGKYGITMIPRQIIVYKGVESQLEKYAFADSSSEES